MCWGWLSACTTPNVNSVSFSMTKLWAFMWWLIICSWHFELGWLQEWISYICRSTERVSWDMLLTEKTCSPLVGGFNKGQTEDLQDMLDLKTFSLWLWETWRVWTYFPLFWPAGCFPPPLLFRFDALLTTIWIFDCVGFADWTTNCSAEWNSSQSASRSGKSCTVCFGGVAEKSSKRVPSPPLCFLFFTSTICLEVALSFWCSHKFLCDSVSHRWGEFKQHVWQGGSRQKSHLRNGFWKESQW